MTIQKLYLPTGGKIVVQTPLDLARFNDCEVDVLKGGFRSLSGILSQNPLITAWFDATVIITGSLHVNDGPVQKFRDVFTNAMRILREWALTRNALAQMLQIVFVLLW